MDVKQAYCDIDNFLPQTQHSTKWAVFKFQTRENQKTKLASKNPKLLKNKQRRTQNSNFWGKIGEASTKSPKKTTLIIKEASHCSSSEEGSELSNFEDTQ